jgi:hypothetical protein
MPEAADVTFIGTYVTNNPALINVSDHIFSLLAGVVNFFPARWFQWIYIFNELACHKAKYRKEQMFNEPGLFI